MNASAQQMACPRCNGALAPGAQFCGACGSPIGPAAAAPQPPPAYAPPPPGYAPPPPMPNIGAMARGFAGSAGGGNSKQININAPAPAAFDTAMGVIDGMGAEVHYRQPPQGARFLHSYKSMWSTLGIPIKYDGELQVAPNGPAQSVARVSLKVRWGSALPLFLTQAAFTFFASMFNIYFAVYLFFFMALFIGISAWTVSGSIPEKALKDIADKIAQGGGFAPAPQPAPGYAPPVQQPPAQAPAYAAPPPAAPQPAPPSGDSAAIMEQLKQLGALQAAGVLTPAEFEAKKADLLSRL